MQRADSLGDLVGRDAERDAVLGRGLTVRLPGVVAAPSCDLLQMRGRLDMM